MKTLNEVKDRCFVDDEGHWIFKGAILKDGATRIYAPDYTKHPDTAALVVQDGKRAVWHIVNQTALQPGWRVYSICMVPQCVSPHCIAAGPSNSVGEYMAKTGKFKNKITRIVANRKISQARTKLTPEIIALILQSKDNGRVTAERLGINRSRVSMVRCGRSKVFMPVGGMFTGLMSANTAWSKRA